MGDSLATAFDFEDEATKTLKVAKGENYKLSKDGELLKRNMRVIGAELGKGKEIVDLTLAKVVKTEIVIVGGTGGGKYAVGTKVTIKANAPEQGKVFKGWQDEKGNIVSIDAEYTFTVTETVALTAVYELSDVVPDNEGLSVGAIAGIVIGSVVVVGAGGLAIFWFVIKKRPFAELVATTKGIFVKK